MTTTEIPNATDKMELEPVIGATVTLVLQTLNKLPSRLLQVCTWPSETENASVVIWSDDLLPDVEWPSTNRMELFGIELTDGKLVLVNPRPGMLSLNGNFVNQHQELHDPVSSLQILSTEETKTIGLHCGPVVMVYATTYRLD